MSGLPARMRAHGDLRRDSKDLLNAGADEIERLERVLAEAGLRIQRLEVALSAARSGSS